MVADAPAGSTGAGGGAGAKQWHGGMVQDGAGPAGGHLRCHAGGIAWAISVAHVPPGAGQKPGSLSVSVGQGSTHLAPGATVTAAAGHTRV